MSINERIQKLREHMKEHDMDAYYIPTSDFHESEYVGEYFKTREYMSGFSGSAGFFVVTKDESALWTDGRYFLQGEQETKDSEVILMKMGEPGVPTILEYLNDKLEPGDVLGFDGRVVNTTFVNTVYEELDVELSSELDLVDMIWEDRPALPTGKAWKMEDEFAGKSVKEKLADVRSYMDEAEADVLMITSLDDIAWLLNMRGSDVHCSPVVLSYLLVEKDCAHVFLDETKLNDALRSEFKAQNIKVHAYDEFYTFVSTYENKHILLNEDTVNFKAYDSLSDSNMMFSEINCTTLMKAVKNEVEVNHMYIAHRKDGVALTKFIYWLKTHVGKEEMDEVDVAEKLLDFRKQQDGFLEPSFDTIAGYGPNGAIIHYHAKKGTCANVEAKGMLLLDSGGQYVDGTTDVTRTIVLGELSEEEKRDYTTVLKSHIALASASFLYGVSGPSLDVLARMPFWKSQRNYNHGTGHGVGFVLNVHEGPNTIAWNTKKDHANMPLEEGMIQSNEPGIYIAGSHAIRLENLTVVKKDVKNEYGQFMYFDDLTIAPFDRDAIVVEMLSTDEREWLNNYHARCLDTLLPFMNEEEREFLKAATKTI